MNGDRISSFFCFFCALYVLKKSIGLDVGDLHHPAAGFYPFFGGMVLATFSAILFVRSVLVKSRRLNRKAQEEKENPLTIVYTLVGLIVYAFILECAGFMLSTFLLVVLLLKLFEKKKWWVVIATAAIISTASSALFAVLLKSELPKGILEVFF